MLAVVCAAFYSRRLCDLHEHVGMAWLVERASADEIFAPEFTPNTGNVHGENALYECLPIPGDDLLCVRFWSSVTTRGLPNLVGRPT